MRPAALGLLQLVRHLGDAGFAAGLFLRPAHGCAAQANAAFYLSLDPSSTNMPIPFPLTTSDSMPAFFVGTVAPGQTVNWNVDQTLSTNIHFFLYDGLFVATPAPEPASARVMSS